VQIENPGEDPKRRSLMLALQELTYSLDALPFNSPKRGDLIREIRRLEDELETMP
jgi:hypothetical protein